LEKKIAELEEKLREHEKRIKALEDTPTSLKTEGITPSQAEPEIRKLATRIDVDPRKIRELFDIEGNSLTLLRIIGKDEREKTKKASLAVLLGYKHLFGNEQVLSQEIRRNVSENRVPINNFATYLNELIPSLIRRKGKPRSPKTTYKLTPLGDAEAREVFKDLCG